MNNVVTCGLLSQHAIYDKDIEERLDKAISKIVTENDALRFLLFKYAASHGPLFDMFAAIAYRAKLMNPDKEIKLSAVVFEDHKEQEIEALRSWQYDLPSFMVDEVLSQPAPKNVGRITERVKQGEKWIAEQSDYIFSYYYDCLYYSTRADLTEAERTQFYNKYIKPMHLKIEENGDVTIHLRG